MRTNNVLRSERERRLVKRSSRIHTVPHGPFGVACVAYILLKSYGLDCCLCISTTTPVDWAMCW